MNMAKHLITVLLFLHCLPSPGQRSIEVARLYTVNLFFGEKIKDVDIGDPLYFQVDRDSGIPRLGITLNPALEPMERRSNMTVVSESGRVYSFLLTTAAGESPKELNIRVGEQDAVFSIDQGDAAPDIGGPAKAITEVTEPKHYYNQADPLPFDGKVGADTPENGSITAELYATDRMEYYRRKAYYHIGDREQIYHVNGKSGRVYLVLGNVKYNNNELYLFLKVMNREGLDLDISSLRTSIAPLRERGNTYQKTAMEPVFSYNVPKRVKGRDEHHFVLVFEKFALDGKKALYIDLDELGGDRNIQLAVDSGILNDPKRF